MKYEIRRLNFEDRNMKLNVDDMSMHQNTYTGNILLKEIVIVGEEEYMVE